MLITLSKLVRALHLHLLTFSNHLYRFIHAAYTQGKGLDNNGNRTGKEEPSDREDTSISSYL